MFLDCSQVTIHKNGNGTYTITPIADHEPSTFTEKLNRVCNCGSTLRTNVLYQPKKLNRILHNV